MDKSKIEASLERVIDILVAGGVADHASIKGCTAADIIKVERTLRVALPAAYSAYLRRMGKGAGEFLAGTDVTYPAILHFNQRADALLSRCGIAQGLTKDAVVFLIHQDYQFMMFNADGNPDPPVLRFVDNEKGLRKVFSSFTKWLLACAKDEVEAFRELS